jgi:hypothetical protein
LPHLERVVATRSMMGRDGQLCTPWRFCGKRWLKKNVGEVLTLADVCGIKTKNGKPRISPLRPPTLASVKTWGIQQELVVPICRCKIRKL